MREENSERKDPPTRSKGGARTAGERIEMTRVRMQTSEGDVIIELFTE